MNYQSKFELSKDYVDHFGIYSALPPDWSEDITKELLADLHDICFKYGKIDSDVGCKTLLTSEISVSVSTEKNSLTMVARIIGNSYQQTCTGIIGRREYASPIILDKALTSEDLIKFIDYHDMIVDRKIGIGTKKERPFLVSEAKPNISELRKQVCEILNEKAQN